MAQQKMVSPNTKISFIPIAGVADLVAGPTLTEANAGTDISCAIVTGYNMNPTDPDTDDSTSICDGGNVVNQTYQNFELDMTFFRDGVLADGASVYNIALALFSAPVEGIFTRRIGKLSTLAYVATDVIDWFGFTVDYFKELDARKTPQQFSIKGIPDGYGDTAKVL